MSDSLEWVSDAVDESQRLILDPGSDDAALLRAISLIQARGAPATLWTQVANDPRYRAYHRALAVQALFVGHVTTPVTLNELALLLDGGCWVLDDSIERIELIGGEIPVSVPAGGAAFAVRLPRDPTMGDREFGIYLALDRALSASQLRDALRSSATDATILEARIVDFALFPNDQ